MSPIGAEDLYPWVAPDHLLQALYELGRQTRGRQAGIDLVRAVAPLLEHEDEDIRQEALRLLLVQWKEPGFRRNAVEMLLGDPSEAVRGTAAFGIASVSTPVTRREDARALLEQVRGEAIPLHVRGAAYEGLLIMHRRPEFPPGTREVDPSVDFDWGWIRELERNVSETDY